MNSNSKGHYQNEKDCSCKKNKEDGTKVLLKCKSGVGTTVTVAGAVTPLPAVITQLAKFSLKTGCFHDPCTKFEFSTNLVTTPTAGNASTVVLTFQLFKLCRCETVPEAIGNVWSYPVPGAAVPLTTIITFIVCDCECDNDCGYDDDCCSYYIAASTSTLSGAGTSTDVAFNNPTLSALVVDNTNHC